MSGPVRRTLAAGLLAAAALALAAPAAAEVLVLRDGSRMEVKGAPRVDGRRVLFTTPQGVLAVLPAAEVDLVATDAANRAAAAGAGAGSAPARDGVVLRLTDEDVGHLDPAARPTIALYTTSWCGWCRKTRSLLSELGARFDERDVEQDPEAGLEADRLTDGDGGVPVIHFGETVLIGYNESKLRALVTEWRRAEATARAAEESSRRPAARDPAQSD